MAGISELARLVDERVQAATAAVSTDTAAELAKKQAPKQAEALGYVGAGAVALVVIALFLVPLIYLLVLVRELRCATVDVAAWLAHPLDKDDRRRYKEARGCD